MEYVVTRKDDELYHYGVKGMKWGVRRNLGKKAKIAANLERYADTYDKGSRINNKRADKAELRGDYEKSKIERQKASANIKLRDEMYNMRNKLIKDLSDKDIKQGRKYMMKSGLISGFIGGPVATGVVLGMDQARTQRYIKDQRTKNENKSNKSTIDKGAFKGVDKENYKYFEEMLKSQGSDIRKYKPTEIDEQGRIVRMTLR